WGFRGPLNHYGGGRGGGNGLARPNGDANPGLSAGNRVRRFNSPTLTELWIQDGAVYEVLIAGK
ncbi:hypothetical protein BHE74_00054211, partial [Ensete ventricosum]